MKNTIRNAVQVVIAGLVMTMSAAAQTNTLIDEDFQVPMLSNGTQNPPFAGWSWDNANAVRSRRTDNQSDLPGDPAMTNQTIQLEWTSGQANYDITNTWSAGRAYYLTINASPQSWNGSAQRYLDPSLRQQDGTVLWSDSFPIPLYDNFGRNPWPEKLTFTFLILTDNFTAGTPGQPLSLKIAHSGQRGIYVDNVRLVEGDPPIDTDPPTPDPMAWAVEPYLLNADSITMTATNASDANGVEYLFTNEVTGTSSGWQNETTWSETGLDPHVLYTYRYKVKARDKSPDQNETGWSPALSAAVDETPPTPDTMTWAFEPMAIDGGNGRVTMTASTASDINLVEYMFTNTVKGTSSGWQDGTLWTETDLTPEATYAYRVKARDKSPGQNETGWSSELSAAIPPAGNVLLDENFQYPLYGDNTQDPYFAGWTWDGASNLRVQVAPGDGVPGTSTNRVIQFSYTSAEANYDLGHAWSADDVYSLTIHAAPQAWSGSNQRYLEPSLRQTDGTILWIANVAVPLYDPSFAGADPWPESLTFTFLLPASEFTMGTEGERLVLKIDSTGQRGLFVDNVLLELAAPEKPTGPVLIIR